MSIFISGQNLSKSFGPRPLFENLTFGLSRGEKTGLIGPNGTGKSTLLKILAGLERVDSGILSVRRGLTVGYLPQEEEFGNGTKTLREEIVQALAGQGLESWESDIRVDEAISRLGGPGPEAPVSGLSGGWRKRLAIAALAAREPELLLLDEPTNHLDLEGVLWLEEFLSEVRFSYLVVTHDRRFLERISNRVIELDKRYPQGHFSSPGNYSRFLEKREELFEQQAAREDKIRNIVRGEIEWLRKGPKARTTKQQARIDRAGDLIGELAELKYRNSQTRAADIDFSASGRETRKLVEFKEVEKSLGGKKLFGPLDLRLRPGDKLGLLGENGSGKSTLLKLIAGELAPDHGQIKRADGLKVVTFDQRREQLDLGMTLKRALVSAGEHVEYKGSRVHVYGWASRFLFRGEQMELPLSRLSGGERARVLIAKLMLEPADVLLLDEPTNDLDLPSLEVLENSLAEFAGALVLVTHDRYLLDRLSKEILSLDGRGHARYYADLAQWEDARPREAFRPEPAAPPPPPSPLSPKEAKELKGMEAAIAMAERESEKARAALEDPSVAADAGELHKRHQALDAALEKIAALYARWEALEARK